MHYQISYTAVMSLTHLTNYNIYQDVETNVNLSKQRVDWTVSLHKEDSELLRDIGLKPAIYQCDKLCAGNDVLSDVSFIIFLKY